MSAARPCGAGDLSARVFLIAMPYILQTPQHLPRSELPVKEGFLIQERFIEFRHFVFCGSRRCAKQSFSSEQSLPSPAPPGS